MLSQIEPQVWLLGGVAVLISFLIGCVAHKLITAHRIRCEKTKAKNIVEEAKLQADGKKRESELMTKDLLLKMRAEFESETKERRQELAITEKRLLQREENLDKKIEIAERKEKEIEQNWAEYHKREGLMRRRDEELSALLMEEKKKLEKISGMTKEEAKKALLMRMVDEAKKDSACEFKRIVDQTKENSAKEAKKIIGLAIQKTCVDHTVETTCSVVNLPGDEVKGRIIGREGRNIRAFEMATGIDVIIDDTPGAVILSGFDKVRREVARISLEKLIEDGRIHPGRIEEVVEKVKQDMDESIKEVGEEAAFDMGVHNLSPELIKLLGRLKYRTSYGQNVLQHSKEVSSLMGVIAGELGLDSPLARRIGLLHDIGKAVSHEVDGGHAIISMELAKKHNEPDVVCHALGAHHGDIEPKTLTAILIQACDAISASRPGARREELESYIKRLEKLEAISNSFKGVEKSFAIQAGRELRVIVQPQKIADEEAIVLARDITKKIESELQFPGQIKTVVIREVRAVEYAK